MSDNQFQDTVLQVIAKVCYTVSMRSTVDDYMVQGLQLAWIKYCTL